MTTTVRVASPDCVGADTRFDNSRNPPSQFQSSTRHRSSSLQKLNFDSSATLPRIKNVGIVAGLGPLASSHFYSRFVRRCQECGATQDDEFPVIRVVTVKRAGLDCTGQSNRQETQRALLAAIAELSTCGSELIACPCNTVELVMSDLRRLSRVEILNIVCETADRAARQGASTVAVCSSSETSRERLYYERLMHHGMRVVELSIEEQSIVTEVIAFAMAGDDLAKGAVELRQLIQRLRSRGVEIVILGCTELSLYTPWLESELRYVDSTESLCAALVERVFCL